MQAAYTPAASGPNYEGVGMWQVAALPVWLAAMAHAMPCARLLVHA